VKFSFKKNEFDKYIFEEAKELKRSGISIDDIKKSISKNNLDALSKSGFIAILREDNDGAVVTEYYPINKGELVWSNIEKRQNEFDIERDGEEFDLLENDDEELSETDED
jgi:methylase of polypeptide subunit release factors